jgi:hypothetical protein
MEDPRLSFFLKLSQLLTLRMVVVLLEEEKNKFVFTNVKVILTDSAWNE